MDDHKMKLVYMRSLNQGSKDNIIILVLAATFPPTF